MSVARDKPPTNLQHLERLLADWSKADNVTAGRMRRRVGVLVVAAMLDNVRDEHGNHQFVAKGGAALDMRFGHRARTSKDLDAVYRGLIDEAFERITQAIKAGWHGFGGRVLDDGEVNAPLRAKPRRFNIKLTYAMRDFVTIPMEVAAPEGEALLQVDRVQVSLAELGVPLPRTVPCLSVRYQIAQKLHACTDPLDGLQLNDRAHDLADLILLEELLRDDDLTGARAACVEIFELREKQPWPPALVDPGHWEALWLRIVEDNNFPITDLADAIARVRQLIERIDRSV